MRPLSTDFVILRRGVDGEAEDVGGSDGDRDLFRAEEPSRGDTTRVDWGSSPFPCRNISEREATRSASSQASSISLEMSSASIIS
jgi:hypothetical protein